MMSQIVVQFTGPEHSGKTSLMVVLAAFLKEQGVDVRLQMADPQIADKLAQPQSCLERLQDATVVMREYKTPV